MLVVRYAQFLWLKSLRDEMRLLGYDEMTTHMKNIPHALNFKFNLNITARAATYLYA